MCLHLLWRLQKAVSPPTLHLDIVWSLKPLPPHWPADFEPLEQTRLGSVHRSHHLFVLSHVLSGVQDEDTGMNSEKMVIHPSWLAGVCVWGGSLCVYACIHKCLYVCVHKRVCACVSGCVNRPQCADCRTRRCRGSGITEEKCRIPRPYFDWESHAIWATLCVPRPSSVEVSVVAWGAMSV